MRLQEADALRLGPTGLPIIPEIDVATGYPAGFVPLPPQPAQVTAMLLQQAWLASRTEAQ